MSKTLYRLKGYKNGTKVFDTTRKKKLTLLSFCKAKFSSKAINKVYFKVLYGKGKVNEGFFNSLKEFVQAYRAFTEKSLVDYIKGR